MTSSTTSIAVALLLASCSSRLDLGHDNAHAEAGAPSDAARADAHAEATVPSEAASSHPHREAGAPSDATPTSEGGPGDSSPPDAGSKSDGACTGAFHLSSTVTLGEGTAFAGMSRVAASPGGYGAAWTAAAPPAVGTVEGAATFGVLDGNGKLVAAPTTLTTKTFGPPAVAWNGSSYSVLYVQASSQSTGGDLRLVLIDPTGAASSSNVLDQGYEDVSDLRLGWSGKMHLSVALLAGDILGTLLIRLAVASGQVFNQGLNYLSGADGIVSVSNVVFGGSQFAFAWVDEQDFGVHVAFVSEDGNSFTPEPGYVVSGSVPSVTSVSPVIGWTGQDYVVGWFAASGQAGQTRLVTVHVDTSGNPSGAPQTWGTLSSGLVGEGLTWGPGEIAAIVGSNQDDGSASGWEYSLARFSASGDAGSSLAVGETAPAYAPFAAWTGEDYALTWVDTVQGGPAHDRVAFARAGGCD